MSEFKGTKEKWLISDCKRKIEISNSKRKTYDSIFFVSGRTNWQYDIKLASKAPEMLEVLKELVALHEMMVGDKGTTTIKAKQLIKEATEL